MQNLLLSLRINKILRNIAVFIGLFSAILIFCTPAQSQVTFCYPDCPKDLWNPLPTSPAFTHLITLPCGEPVIVHYRIFFSSDPPPQEFTPFPQPAPFHG